MGTFNKYPTPVFGDESTGTTFDAYIWMDNGRYRMDFSWRPRLACAVTFSDDGIHWDEPIITLPHNPDTDWEENLNRNCVLKVDGIYKMWYTGQSQNSSRSFIGYAESEDGLTFHRVQEAPVLVPEYTWELKSVMNPCVMYENGKYRMWYSAGETYEPNVNAYAESEDGLHWHKHELNPVFTHEPNNWFEQDRVGGCQVIHTEDMGYLMFYIGYEDINTARVCVARSDDGITGWERSSLNPRVEPTRDTWDHHATYKPTVVWNEAEGKWMLWYNGRRDGCEYIGYAEFHQRNLFPKN